MKGVYRTVLGCTLAGVIAGFSLLSPQVEAKVVHRVQRGESLFSIARRYEMSVDELAGLNGITNYNYIEVGMELSLGSSFQLYRVRAGESLWSISKKFNINYQDLLKYNNIKNPNNIKPGMELKIHLPYIMYKVRKGENLWSIGQKYNVDYQELIRINNIKNPQQIEAGTELRIPRGSKININQTRKGNDNTSNTTIKQQSFIWPAKGRISSPFGPRWGKMHWGIDIALPVGRSITAAAAGKVVWSGWVSGYGLTIIIDHQNGFRTLYAHNSKLLVSSGKWVKQGQLIAKSGNTGRSTGPHLHFEIQKDGRALNPMNFLP